jgi:hypothetical protein
MLKSKDRQQIPMSKDRYQMLTSKDSSPLPYLPFRGYLQEKVFLNWRPIGALRPARHKGLFAAQLLLLVLLIGIVAYPQLARWSVIRRVESLLGGSVIIGSMYFSPYSFTLDMKDIRYQGDGGALNGLSIDRMSAGVGIDALAGGAITLEAVHFERPVLDLDVPLTDSTRLFDALAAAGEKIIERTAGLTVTLNNVRIVNGRIHCRLPGGGNETTVDAIQLELPRVSTRPDHRDRFIHPAISASIGQTRLALNGRIKPFSERLETRLTIDITGIDLTGGRPAGSRFIQMAAGRMDVNGHFLYTRPPNAPALSVFNGLLFLQGTAVRTAFGHSLLTLPSALLDVRYFDPAGSRLNIRSAVVQGAILDLRNQGADAAVEALVTGLSDSLDINADSVELLDSRIRIHNHVFPERSAPSPDLPSPESHELMRLNRLAMHYLHHRSASRALLVEKVEASGGVVQLKKMRDGSVDLGLLKGLLPQPSATPAPVSVPGITIGEMTLLDFTVRHESDASDPLNGFFMDDLTLTAIGTTTRGEALTDFSAYGRANGGGLFTVSGRLRAGDSADRLLVKVSDIPFPGFSIAVPTAGQVSIDSAVSAGGHLWIGPTASGRKSHLQFDGSLTVKDIKAIDDASGATLMTAAALSASGVQLDLSKRAFSADGIDLHDVGGHIRRNADGRWRPSALTGGEHNNAPPSHPNEPSLPSSVRIGRFSVHQGDLQISDATVSPAFTATVSGVRGHIDGISTMDQDAAQFHFDARLDGRAPLVIEGSAEKEGGTTKTTVALSMSGLDLASLSPYSRRYFGSAIRDGTMSVDADYTIKGARLDGSHHIDIERLAWDTNSGPPSDRAKLALDRATALLGGRGESIQLAVTVGGSLDDPANRIDRLIADAVGDILRKAVGSPSDIVARNLGESALEPLIFEPGTSRLSRQARHQLDRVADVLYETPALRLEITGMADSLSDREEIAKKRLLSAIGESKASDSSDPSLAEPIPGLINDENALWKVYRKAPFKKPRNFFGMVKRLPPEDMRARLLDHLKPPGRDLERLARNRANSVRNYLVKSGKVKTHQVLTKAYPAFESGPRDRLEKSRVELYIR